MSLEIQLKLFATLAKYTPPDPDHFPIEEGETAAQVLERLNVPLKEVKLVFIDGVRKDLDWALNGGERVGIFPPVGGG
ncbi:thiamineS protein [Desulfatibacillum aliphaticivorans]|uniref:ThiamineS protein n=1 Tax=Desulfatibacillum aliphaticivorans TaxID=218208 RepID=B8FF03_DESAL|nr:MoaD/ThiS family protein [Desulfatibacillum aliphaticivorans]ACL03680.1 thiamineS protein [Desulfatibacillum aliphaticivorans]